MNRTIRAIIGAILVLVIAFSAITICRNFWDFLTFVVLLASACLIGSVIWAVTWVVTKNHMIAGVLGGIVTTLILAFSGGPAALNHYLFPFLSGDLKVDITDQGLYTLSDGTKSILAKLNQPLKAKLYYAKTASLKGPDQIRFFSNYYEFVKALLEEYVAASKGMVTLEIIDPRPFTDDEEQALKYGLRRFPITEEESFFFGLVVQTPFGVEKAIPFFSPDRQNFVEYDISYLIDTAVTRQKKTVGVLSSLPVMGDDVSGYMAEMMMRQGQQPEPPWTFVEQLRKQYEVKSVPTDVNDVNDMNDVDILLVIHPKDLPERTQFAIDQYVLKGGRTIVCVDPYCFADRPPGMQMQMAMQQSHSSDLNKLLRTWGLEMPADTFAGDRTLASLASIRANQRPERIIGYLGLTPEAHCFDKDNVITAELNQVRFLFSGVLKEVTEPNEAKEGGSKIQRTPLVMTGSRGNTFTISSPYELMILDGQSLMRKFTDGNKPVVMAYLVTGRLKSSFPDGIEVEVPASGEDASQKPEDPNQPKTIKKRLTGLKEAQQDCDVVVFADVDFISDNMAYQNSFFGKMIVGDNSTLMQNAVDDLSGSSDLVSIRSRGNFKRPFVVVDEIERQAEAETAEEVDKINMQIAGFQNELQSIVASAQKGQEEVIGSSIVQKKQDLELKILQAQRQVREIKLSRLDRTNRLKISLEVINMGAVPGMVIWFGVVLGLRRSMRKSYYISHASDA
jgi:ABC-2 type transport system permease protein